MLADRLFDTDRYLAFCAESLPDLDDRVYEWVTSPAFIRLLTDTIASTYPDEERDRFTAHFAGLIQLWVDDQGRPRA